jgi:hypothetical protein
MAFWYYIKTESGQSITDIALQEYGTDAIEVLNQIAIDNIELFTDGITTLLYAGMSIALRTDYALRNKKITAYFADTTINNHNHNTTGNATGDDDPPVIVDDEGLIITVDPGQTVEVALATDSAEAIFINYFLKEVPTSTELQTERYVGKIRIINDTDSATATLTGNEYDNTNSTWQNTAFAAGTAEGYITLSITAPADKTVYFKRHVVTVL